MKLLFCLKCQDVRKLRRDVTSCECGLSRGRYLEDGLAAEHNGKGYIIGLDNAVLANALRHVIGSADHCSGVPEQHAGALTGNGDRVTLVRNPRLEAWLMTDSPAVSIKEEV